MRASRVHGFGSDSIDLQKREVPIRANNNQNLRVPGLFMVMGSNDGWWDISFACLPERDSPPGSGGGLKAVRSSGGGRIKPYTELHPSGLTPTLSTPEVLRASSPPKIRVDFLQLPCPSIGARKLTISLSYPFPGKTCERIQFLLPSWS